jgi:hypothetical protein
VSVIVGVSVDRRAARARQPDAIALDAAVKLTAAAVLLEEGVEGVEETGVGVVHFPFGPRVHGCRRESSIGSKSPVPPRLHRLVSETSDCPTAKPRKRSADGVCPNGTRNAYPQRLCGFLWLIRLSLQFGGHSRLASYPQSHAGEAPGRSLAARQRPESAGRFWRRCDMRRLRGDHHSKPGDDGARPLQR